MEDIIREKEEIQDSIAEEKKEIERLCGEIGKKYVELRRDEPDPELADLVGAVRGAEERIAEMENKLNVLENGTPCPVCGRICESDAAFCIYCGAPMKAEEKPAEGPRCPECGAPVDDDAIFCVNCGARIVKEEPAAVEPPVVEPPVVEPSSEYEMQR